MTNSPIDSPTPQERVRSYLRKALPDCRLTSEELALGHSPVILMWMTHAMAAFAFSNGDTGRSYETLYGRFKDYYADHRKRLDELDLSFVFCVRPDLPDLDKFSSRVETDVYFCRKFVVPLAIELERSFDRLPFVPLPLEGASSKRPPSAQTYMRQCGVPAVLARYLAVPHQRGPENIVRDCIENKSNWTPLLAGQSQPDAPAAETKRGAERVRLDSVHVESFRAYKKPQTFRLGAAVTVLYGPNGFGKTSLFDAIDFAATGGIGRLGLPPTSERFAKVVGHLDGRPQEAVVSLRFGANGARRQIRRQVVSRMQASLDGASADRKEVLVGITGGGGTPADRVEHLVSLFRATHLYSQEHQELAKGFDRDCVLPEQVVAHMLAFEDYANARNKASKVCEIFVDAIARRKYDIEELTKAVKEMEGELRRLDESAEDRSDFGRPMDVLKALRGRMEQAGVAVGGEEQADVFVRQARATIQARLAEGQARVARLTTLGERVNGLPGVRAGLAKLVKKRAEVESDIGAAELAVGKAEEIDGNADAMVTKLEEQRSRARLQVELVGWIRERQPRYSQLRRREAGRIGASKEAGRKLEVFRESLASARGYLASREREVAEVGERLRTTRDMGAQLAELGRAEADWRRDRTRTLELEGKETVFVGRLEQLRSEWRAKAAQLKENEAEQKEVEKAVAEVERGQTELTELVSRVQGNVHDGCCPLCGHDYGSVGELVGRIDAQMAEDRATVPRAGLARIRDARRELDVELTGMRKSADRERAVMEGLKREREDCAERIVAFEAAAAKVGVGVQDATVVKGEIEARGEQIAHSIRELEGRNRSLLEIVERRQTEIRHLERNIQDSEGVRSEAERELNDCRDEIAQLLGDPRAEQLPLDTEPARVDELEKRESEALKGLEVAFAQAVKRARSDREAESMRARRVSSLRSALDGLKREISSRRRAVAEANALLAECGLAADAGEAEVVRLLEQQTRANSQVTELGDFADSVEVALDTASTAAALQQQRQAVRQKERRIEAAREDIEVYDAWRRYFGEVAEKVADRQREAVMSFAKGYGSMASAIQQRLRAVYGFHGIDTRNHEATIRVRVKRRNESLKPTDYFSHSQQQTLLLGLFLTACMSQTWSSLSTVLLDDPVTHFDDLNTYAFLDMILGLLSAGSGPQQFIISTCDQKVFDLARTKFRRLGADAVFYGFSAIGPDGPVVEEVTRV